MFYDRLVESIGAAKFIQCVWQSLHTESTCSHQNLVWHSEQSFITHWRRRAWFQEVPPAKPTRTQGGVTGRSRTRAASMGGLYEAVALRAQCYCELEIEAREIWTPSLLIWSQTRCRCAIAPLHERRGLVASHGVHLHCRDVQRPKRKRRWRFRLGAS